MHETSLLLETSPSTSNITKIPGAPTGVKKQVYIGNLSYETTEQSLIDFFKPVGGKILDTVIRTRRRKKTHRQITSGHHQRPQTTYYGFITFEDESYAQKAVEMLDQQAVDGQKVSVQWARSNRRSEPSMKQLSHNNSNDSSSSSSSSVNASTGSIEAESESLQIRKKQKSSDPININNNGSQQKEKGKLSNRASKDSTLSSTTVFVANLPYSATDDDLRNIIYPDYRIVSAFIARMKNGRSKGYAFVDFESEEEQKRALDSVGSVTLNGRVVYAKPARQHGSTGKSQTEPPLIYYAFQAQRSYSDLVAFNTGF